MKKLIAFIMLLPLLAAAQFNPYQHNAFSTNLPPTAAAVYQRASMAVTNFNSFRFTVLGDSLSTTNNSAEIIDGPNGIWPGILTNNYGYTLLTNAAFGGQGADNASGVQVLNASNYWPSATGKRSIWIWWAGKNNYNNTTNAINLVSNSVVAAEQMALNAGADLVLIDQPYTHTNTPVAGYVGVNIQRQMLNNWIDSQTNNGYPVLVMDSVLPISMLSNSATAWNATYMIDGLHFTTAANTIIAAALVVLIQNSAIATNSMVAANSQNSPWFPSALGSGTTVGNSLNPVLLASGAPAVFNIDDYESGGNLHPVSVQVSYGGYGYGVGGYAPTMGATFYCNRNLTFATADWGFRFASAQGSYTNTTLFVDTSVNLVGIALPQTSNPIETLEVNGGVLADGAHGFTFHSSVWSLATATNGMVNFDNRLTQSNGVPIMIYWSNAVPFINFFTTGGTVLP